MFKNLNLSMIGIRASLSQTHEMAVAYGFDGVDLNITEIDDMARKASLQEVKDLFKRTGRRPGNWGLPVQWSGDRQKWEEGLAWLRVYGALARDIEAFRTSAVVMPWSDDRPFAENYAFHVERLKPIAEALQAYGCRLGLEFIGPATLRRGRKHEFICTMDGMLDLCQELGSNVGLLLDLWHWYTSHGAWEDLRQLNSAQIVNVHVNDAPAGIPVDEQIDHRRCLPGETGVLDVTRFLARLHDIGYDGPITPEPFSDRVNALSPNDALQETSAAMQRAWPVIGTR